MNNITEKTTNEPIKSDIYWYNVQHRLIGKHYFDSQHDSKQATISWQPTRVADRNCLSDFRELINKNISTKVRKLIDINVLIKVNRELMDINN